MASFEARNAVGDALANSILFDQSTGQPAHELGVESERFVRASLPSAALGHVLQGKRFFIGVSKNTDNPSGLKSFVELVQRQKAIRLVEKYLGHYPGIDRALVIVISGICRRVEGFCRFDPSERIFGPAQPSQGARVRCAKTELVNAKRRLLKKPGLKEGVKDRQCVLRPSETVFGIGAVQVRKSTRRLRIRQGIKLPHGRFDKLRAVQKGTSRYFAEKQAHPLPVVICLFQ